MDRLFRVTGSFSRRRSKHILLQLHHCRIVDRFFSSFRSTPLDLWLCNRWGGWDGVLRDWVFSGKVDWARPHDPKGLRHTVLSPSECSRFFLQQNSSSSQTPFSVAVATNNALILTACHDPQGDLRCCSPRHLCGPVPNGCEVCLRVVDISSLLRSPAPEDIQGNGWNVAESWLLNQMSTLLIQIGAVETDRDHGMPIGLASCLSLSLVFSFVRKQV